MPNNLISDVKEDYFFLGMIHPGHELLRYFTLNDKDYSLKFSSDLKVQDNFIKRFGPKIQRAFRRYGKDFCPLTFKNYFIALEYAINYAKGKIILN